MQIIAVLTIQILIIEDALLMINIIQNILLDQSNLTQAVPVKSLLKKIPVVIQNQLKMISIVRLLPTPVKR